MKIWEVLGIEKTKDKDVIQAAYRDRLIQTHPEDDPEGFMELRRALEEALREADRDGEELEAAEADFDWGTGPVADWMEKVEEIYKDFGRRVDPQEWSALLQEDVCMNLDTKLEARDNLLTFMMTYFFLPQDVMLVIDDAFGLMENMDELEEEFPKEFLEYIVVRGIKHEESPPYKMLSGDTSCDFDGYLKLNARLNHCIGTGKTDESFEILEKMSVMGINDPYNGISAAKVLSQTENYDDALEELDYVIDGYPEIDDAHLLKGDICILINDFENARASYAVVYDMDPDNDWAKCGMAKCLVNEGKYKEANKMLSEVASDNPYDVDAHEWLEKCNKEYIAELREQIRESRNQDNYLDLAWCYYQNDEYSEAMLVLEQIEPDEKHRVEYMSLMGRSAANLDKHTEALEYMLKWEDALETVTPDKDEAEKECYKLSYCLLMQSFTLGQMGKTKEALTIIEKALETDPEDEELYVQKGLLLSKQWYLDDAVEVFTKAIELNPESHGVYVMRARALFYMGFYGEAFDDCEKSLEIFPYEVSAYVFKIKIFIEVGEFDEADAVLDFLDSEGLTGSEIDFLRAFVLEARGEEKEAAAVYRRIIDEYTGAESGNNQINVHNLAEVYHHLAVIEHYVKKSGFGKVRLLLDKGMKEDPDYIQTFEMKAELLHEQKKYEDAIALYEEIAEKAPGRIGIYGMMDTLYRETDEWEKALECAEKQLEQAASGYSYMRRGQIYAYMNMNEEAESDFKKAMALAPELSYPYNYMGVLKECGGDDDAALEYYLKAVTVGEKEDDLCDEAYQHASDQFCRRNDLVNAMRMLEKGYENTGDCDFLLSQVQVHRKSGNFTDARETLVKYRRAKGLSITDAEYIIQLAHIARDEGNLEEAFRFYMSIFEDDAEAALEAGKILYYNGEYNEALDCFLDAADIFLDEENDQGIMYLMGEHFLWAARAARDGGLIDEMKDLVQEGLKFIPDEPELYESCLPMIEKILGGLHAVAGNYEEAMKHLNSAVKRRKCDFCQKGYCTDACFEIAYLNLINNDYEEAERILELALEFDMKDPDLKGLKRKMEKRD